MIPFSTVYLTKENINLVKEFAKNNLSTKDIAVYKLLKLYQFIVIMSYCRKLYVSTWCEWLTQI